MLNSIVKSLVCSSFLIEISVCGIIQNEEPCYSQGGNCRLRSQCRDTSSVQSGLCPSQPANIVCCLPYQESVCSALGGQCVRTDSGCDGGNYVNGKCPTQPNNVKCCVANGERGDTDGEGGGEPDGEGDKGGGGEDGNDEFEYNSATRCTGAAQPGTECLLRYMKENSPSGRSMGIYVCRNIGGSSQISLHAEGRALDWRLNVNNALQEEEAQQLINQFLANESSLAKRMGIQEIIHNRRIWSSRYSNYGLRPYNGQNPHTDHIHIGLNWKGARKETSFWQSYSC